MPGGLNSAHVHGSQYTSVHHCCGIQRGECRLLQHRVGMVQAI